MKNIMIVSAIALYLVSSTVFADASHGENESSVGKAGDPNNVSRSIVLQMTFNRFKPSKINVKRGETIKFVLKNISKKKHEFMIATMTELKKHAKMMRKHPDMEHDESNKVTVNSGERRALVWQFTEVGTVDFACPKSGHFKGMRGEIKVSAK
jgi:uncharacterized cupredoxin-like copper-binding protein